MKNSMPVCYSIMTTKECLDELLNIDGDLILVTDYYESAFNQDYYFVELEIVSDGKIKDLSDVYLFTGAVAIHEEDTSGVFIDKDDVEKVNDVFGWDGAGAYLLYSMLTANERIGLLIDILKKKFPFADESMIFIYEKKQYTEKEPVQEQMDFQENWETLEDRPNLYNDDEYECRMYTGEKILTYGTGGEDISSIMEGTGMVCYVFDLMNELDHLDDNIEVLDLTKKPPMLPAPLSNEKLLEQYNKGFITEAEFNSRSILKDKDATEIQRELKDAWERFGEEMDDYGQSY